MPAQNPVRPELPSPEELQELMRRARSDRARLVHRAVGALFHWRDADTAQPEAGERAIVRAA